MRAPDTMPSWARAAIRYLEDAVVTTDDADLMIAPISCEWQVDQVGVYARGEAVGVIRLWSDTTGFGVAIHGKTHNEEALALLLSAALEAECWRGEM